MHLLSSGFIILPFSRLLSDTGSWRLGAMSNCTIMWSLLSSLKSNKNSYLPGRHHWFHMSSLHESQSNLICILMFSDSLRRETALCSLFLCLPFLSLRVSPSRPGQNRSTGSLFQYHLFSCTALKIIASGKCALASFICFYVFVSMCIHIFRVEVSLRPYPLWFCFVTGTLVAWNLSSRQGWLTSKL